VPAALVRLTWPSIVSTIGTVQDAPQSSPALGRLPASLLVVLLLAAPTLAAQTQRVPQDMRFTRAPGGPVLGTLFAGASVAPGRISGDSIEISFDGWMISGSLGATSRDGFDLIVTARPSENVRQAPNGSVLARLTSGVLLNKLEAKGGWTHVKRTAWVARRGLTAAPAGTATAGGSVPPSAARSPGPPETDQVATLRSTPLSAAAGTAGLGSLDSGAEVRVLSRAGEWTRVQVEGWVKDSDLAPVTDGVLVGVSQAEVRANPSRFVGKVVEWRVQFVAIQQADELRPEIPAGRSYLLTRGPLPEPGFVYVIVPPDQLEQFKSVSALQELTIRATVKAATSKYLPTPVVELVGVVKGLGS
jgi:hypothetical protein